MIKSGNSSVVERNLAKVEVAGSTPVSRSRVLRRHSQVVRQRSAKSPSPVQIRVSPPSFPPHASSMGKKHNIPAGVVEQVDTRDLKSLGCEPVPVQVRPLVPFLLAGIAQW